MEEEGCGNPCILRVRIYFFTDPCGSMTNSQSAVCLTPVADVENSQDTAC